VDIALKDLGIDIDLVPDYGVTNKSEVGPYLMGAARFWDDLEQRILPALVQELIICAGRLSFWVVGTHIMAAFALSS
jgi:hypothetical protein